MLTRAWVGEIRCNFFIMRNVISKVASIMILALFCFIPAANSASGGDPGGVCEGCTVSADSSLNTGRCVFCLNGKDENCTVDGMNTTSPECKPD